LLLGAVLFGGTAQAEEKTLNVIMPWSGEGSIHVIGEETILFSGAFNGIMYAENTSGELDTAFAKCPAQQRINSGSKQASAEGHCNITVSPEDTVYAEWECAGELGACKGTFTLTGGTGRFKGVTGSSKLIVRSVMSQLVVGMGDGSIVREASGLAVLPELKITLAAGY
jgi:hypothetical protein